MKLLYLVMAPNCCLIFECKCFNSDHNAPRTNRWCNVGFSQRSAPTRRYRCLIGIELEKVLLPSCCSVFLLFIDAVILLTVLKTMPTEPRLYRVCNPEFQSEKPIRASHYLLGKGSAATRPPLCWPHPRAGHGQTDRQKLHFIIYYY